MLLICYFLILNMVLILLPILRFSFECILFSFFVITVIFIYVWFYSRDLFGFEFVGFFG